MAKAKVDPFDVLNWAAEQGRVRRIMEEAFEREQAKANALRAENERLTARVAELEAEAAPAKSCATCFWAAMDHGNCPGKKPCTAWESGSAEQTVEEKLREKIALQADQNAEKDRQIAALTARVKELEAGRQLRWKGADDRGNVFSECGRYCIGSTGIPYRYGRTLGCPGNLEAAQAACQADFDRGTEVKA